jgi:Glycosyl transferase family 2
VPRRGGLVTIGLPTRNGERALSQAVQSVLDQSYGPLELVISDNASDDGTEEICRQFARADARVRYYRQPRNIGLVGNFEAVLRLARGTYLKWLGDDDWLTPTYVERCVEVLDDDAALILVTTQQAHVDPDGTVETAAFDATRLRSARPVERFAEMLRLLNESHLLLDPLYGLMRRTPVSRLPRPVMVFEDQVFAARLALAGPFGHVHEVLSYRRAHPFPPLTATADKLGVPRWQAKVATALQCRELLRAVREAELSPRDRRLAAAAVAGMFVRRQRVTAIHRGRELARLVARPGTRPGPRRVLGASGAHQAPFRRS